MRVEDYGNGGAKLELMTLSQIRKAAQNGPAEARVHVQVEAASAKLTREQKPFCELALADAADRMTLRVWSDHPEYKACGALQTNDFIELSGEFQQHQQFGLDAKSWKGARAHSRGKTAAPARSARAASETGGRLGLHSRVNARDRRSAFARAL